MISPYGYCQVSIAPIRSEAKDSSEMVTQLLFGEVIEVIETDRQWRKVRNLRDNYEGWTDKKLLSSLTEKEMKRWMDQHNAVFNPTFLVQSKNGTITITKGACLPNSNEITKFKIGNEIYVLQSDLSDTPSEIEEIALSYQNSPYLWGGRSNFGIDCSGFTQMVFRFINYSLPRDAYQQAEDGREVSFEESEPGDLAFFDNAEGKITHVGILLSGNTIIHAHGYVKIDTLKKEGIFNEERQLMSHKLCLVKRYI